MKVNRKSEINSSILFFAVSVGFFLFGVGVGLQRRWEAMGVTFVCVVFLFHFAAFSLMKLRIDSCFKRLEELTSKRSDSAPPKTQK
jgi:amino acid transporter